MGFEVKCLRELLSGHSASQLTRTCRKTLNKFEISSSSTFDATIFNRKHNLSNEVFQMVRSAAKSELFVFELSRLHCICKQNKILFLFYQIEEKLVSVVIVIKTMQYCSACVHACVHVWECVYVI